MSVERSSVLAAGWKAKWDLTMTRPESQDGTASSADLDDCDDRVVVDAFLAGRREAFDVIVRRHRRSIYLLCHRFVGNHEDASDLSQDVFVRAFKGLARFKHESALSTWLYRVCVNTCLNRVSAKVPETEPVEAADLVDAGATNPLQEIVKQERAARVRRAIRKLPPKQRATLILRVYHELSHDEIARILGSTVGAAKANLFHALGNLKRLMEP